MTNLDYRSVKLGNRVLNLTLYLIVLSFFPFFSNRGKYFLGINSNPKKSDKRQNQKSVKFEETHQ